MKLIFGILPFVLLLNGCAATKLDMNNPVDIASGIKVSMDEYSKKETISGPLISNPNKSGMITWGAQQFLLTETDGVIMLALSDSFPGWRNYYKAIDIDGNELNFTHVNKTVTNNCSLGTCLVIEDVAISLSESYLSDRKNNGLNIKIYGEKDTIIKVSGVYVTTFLDAINQ